MLASSIDLRIWSSRRKVALLYNECMCGRFTYLTLEELTEVVAAIGERATVRLRPGSERSQARPGSAVQAIVSRPRVASPSSEGLSLDTAIDDASALDKPELEIAPLTWGFTLGEGKRLVFNTRIESALGGSPLWKHAIQNGRCIMPVASFFEPHGSETVCSPRTGRPMKRQYEFADTHEQPLLLAGVHDQGRLSIVTTAPNASVAPVHERMPLALRFEEVPTWLEGDFAALADRSGFQLSVRPEQIDSPEIEAAQLTLF